MLGRLLQNHVLANLLFALVLVMGVLSYQQLPREQDPSINFNWLQVTTILPGASAADIEEKITDPLEQAIEKVSDIKFVSSNSRENVSSIVVRFNDIDARTFDKRVNDLRREIQNVEDSLPEDTETPDVFEITTANAFPTATVVVLGRAEDEHLRAAASNIKQDIERLNGVDRVTPMALNDPEIQIRFRPADLQRMGIDASNLADSVRDWFRDVAAGTVALDDQTWLIRIEGSGAEPDWLNRIPIRGAQGFVPLRAVADVSRGQHRATQRVRFAGQPAVLMPIMKQEGANTLQLVERLKDYIDRYNRTAGRNGIRLALADDQTLITSNALSIMQTNAVLGLGFVLVVTWLFLGSRIAILTSIGIPFTLAGTFWCLIALGQTLNTSILLAVVIALGMLVDDAVVVVEAIYTRLQQGMDTLSAALDALREVAAPVTASVLTTMAAFLPLMLLPGILGKFMLVIPLVVTTALAISLIEAFWMLPAHVIAARINFRRPSRTQMIRHRAIHWIKIRYGFLLIRVLRRPKTSLAALFLLFLTGIGVVVSGLVKADFFAADEVRLFYVNIEMPASTALQHTLDTALLIEQKVRAGLRPEELRSVTVYAGQRFTETDAFLGDQHAQIMISLQAQQRNGRTVLDIIEAMRDDVERTPGPTMISFLRLKGGPPASDPINVKVRGDNYPVIRAAADALETYLATVPAAHDIRDDDSPGRQELVLRLNNEAVQAAGIPATRIQRVVRMLADGEIVASLQHNGEKVEVRVLAADTEQHTIHALLDTTLPTADGADIRLGELVHSETGTSKGNIRHYNLRRAITIKGDLDMQQMDTLAINRLLMDEWTRIASDYPGVDLDFTGQLDEIQESIDAIWMLLLFGLGLIYLILGTQFRSYWQPFMILLTVPMAFTGVVLGLLVTGNPLSLFTLYGVVALAGIAVNAAIMLITAANERLHNGMSVLHATVYAARRRVIPILITSLTTIAGLLSLATGLGGHSLMWGPVATAIVWGLGFSTPLTLLVVPLLYRQFISEPEPAAP